MIKPYNMLQPEKLQIYRIHNKNKCTFGATVFSNFASRAAIWWLSNSNFNG